MVFNHVVSAVHPKTALFVQFHIMKSMDQGAHREKFGLEEELCYTPIICLIMVDHMISAQFI